MKCPVYWCLLVLAISLFGCGQKKSEQKDQEISAFSKGSFGYDRDFIANYGEVVTLKSADTMAQVLVSPTYQGRVLTSTFNSVEGVSLGFINHERISSSATTPHIQAYGGEDRFWIGPQGGQYTIFFNPGDPFDFDHWFTPAPIDIEPFETVQRTDSSIEFKKRMEIKNYSGFVFDIEVNRKIRIIDRQQACLNLGLQDLNNIQFVGFESDNVLINKADKPWSKESGLLSIWILGQFPAGATVVIPFKNGAAGQSDKIYNRYFGTLTPSLDRQVTVEGNVLYYNGSGHHIGKIGLIPERAQSLFGSYNAENKVLTIIQYSFSGTERDYVNSQWEWQKNPYNGDVINAYNDGALDPTATFVPTFYELESSSPAKELKRGEYIAHYHRTYHFQGDKEHLDKLCKALLGTSVDQITRQFDGSSD